jgi:hypothetical protein
MLVIRSVLQDVHPRIRRGELTCDIRLQPTPASCAYAVRLSYRCGRRPDVTVIDPALQLRRGAAKLPHVYKDDVLCLNFPGEWRDDMLLAHTVVPWISEWLVYYELWLVTGDWLGGGVHPSSRRRGSRRARRVA